MQVSSCCSLCLCAAQSLTVSRVRRPHPLYEAPSARHYLQFQRRVHSGIARKRLAASTEYFASSPALAPDLTKCAVALARPVRLVLLELPGQSEMGRWALPRLTNNSSVWLWRRDSRCLAATWGRCWNVTGVVGEHVDTLLQTGPGGVSVLDVCAGTVTNVALGVQTPSEPALGGWSDSGLLAVRHKRGEAMVWSLYTALGTKMHSVACPQQTVQSRRGPGVCFAMAPAGSLLSNQDAMSREQMLLSVYSCNKPAHFYIWHWPSWHLHEAQFAEPAGEAQLYWACDGTQILTLTRKGLAVFYDNEGVQLSSQQLPADATGLTWAASGAVALNYFLSLRLYNVHTEPVLVLAHIIERPGLRFLTSHLAFSTDSAHIACPASCELGLVLALVDAARGRVVCMRVLNLNPRLLLDNELALGDLELQAAWWSPDGSRLAVTYHDFSGGGCLHVVDIET